MLVISFVKVPFYSSQSTKGFNRTKGFLQTSSIWAPHISGMVALPKVIGAQSGALRNLVGSVKKWLDILIHPKSPFQLVLSKASNKLEHSVRVGGLELVVWCDWVMGLMSHAVLILLPRGMVMRWMGAKMSVSAQGTDFILMCGKR